MVGLEVRDVSTSDGLAKNWASQCLNQTHMTVQRREEKKCPILKFSKKTKRTTTRQQSERNAGGGYTGARKTLVVWKSVLKKINSSQGQSTRGQRTTTTEGKKGYARETRRIRQPDFRRGIGPRLGRANSEVSNQLPYWIAFYHLPPVCKDKEGKNL